MARNLGVATAALPTSVDGIPPAARSHRSGWRDPRLWIGVVIVAASVVAGARLLAAADDTVQVWAAASDLSAGQRLQAEDLVATRVRFADQDALAGYFTAEEELPADLALTRGVAAGELLPRAAVGADARSGLLEVPIAVEPELVPPSVAAGAVVDVYVVAPAPPEGAGTGAEPRLAPDPGPALSAVAVVDAPELAESFGTSGKRQLVVAVPEEAAARFFELLSAYDAPVLTVVRRG